MKKSTWFVFAVFAAFSAFFACKPDDFYASRTTAPNLPAKAYDYAVKVPVTFSRFFNGGIAIPDSLRNPNGTTVVLVNNTPVNVDPNGFVNHTNGGGFGFGANMQNPPITDAGATLGRVLFYDAKLSRNNAVSCASCHKQNLAFSDNGKGSAGFGGLVTPRNSMAITNPLFNHNLFWDSRSTSAMDLVTKPIQNHIEMGIEDMTALSAKLAEVEYYPELFKQAFGSADIHEQRIASALSQFVNSMTSVDSRFDREQVRNFSGFSTLEKMGMDLFMSKRANCTGCHAQPTFAAADFPGGEYGAPTVKGTANVGLDVVYKDQGKEEGQFRIPSLRNIALTAPYMHDGRFETLEEVVEHYNSGIAMHRKLDRKLRNPDGTPKRLNLDALEKRALVAFLRTLTDETFVRDPKFSDPFK
jgi:cytochrome c peroxidase